MQADLFQEKPTVRMGEGGEWEAIVDPELFRRGGPIESLSDPVCFEKGECRGLLHFDGVAFVVVGGGFQGGEMFMAFAQEVVPLAAYQHEVIDFEECERRRSEQFREGILEARSLKGVKIRCGGSIYVGVNRARIVPRVR